MMNYKRTKMFRKLRLKLTFINVAIILALFVLLSGGIYYFSQMNMARHTDNLARRILHDIQTERISDLPPQKHLPPPQFMPGPPPLPGGDLPNRPLPGPPPEMSFFFVKTDTTGQIISSSGQQPDQNRLAALTRLALHSPAEQGTLTLDNTRYTYYRAPLTNPSGTLLLFRDLTQEINLQQVLFTSLLMVSLLCALLSFAASFFLANRAMIPIQEAWQQQRNFLSDASHELRTPLAVIQTNLAVVRQCPEETVASQNKWLDNIQEETACMAKLVEALLFLARADSSQQPMKKTAIDYTALLQKAVAPFEAVAAAKQVSLILTSIPELTGCGDEAQLKQVLGILTDNAIRHTPPGGEVRVTLAKSSGGIRISVTDSGEGIPPQHLEKIFDRFYQVDSSRNKGGAGLGLAIAKWIVENHEGTITIASTPQKQTAFTVHLP